VPLGVEVESGIAVGASAHIWHGSLLDISYPANGVGFREDGGRGLPNVKARAPGLAETSSPTPAEHGSSAIVDGMPRHRCW
jgi:hypothetical protein